MQEQERARRQTPSSSSFTCVVRRAVAVAPHASTTRLRQYKNQPSAPCRSTQSRQHALHCSCSNKRKCRGELECCSFSPSLPRCCSPAAAPLQRPEDSRLRRCRPCARAASCWRARRRWRTRGGGRCTAAGSSTTALLPRARPPAMARAPPAGSPTAAAARPYTSAAVKQRCSQSISTFLAYVEARLFDLGVSLLCSFSI